VVHCQIIYNAVPEFDPATKDLKSEIGILAAVDDIAKALSSYCQVTLYPFSGDIVHFMQNLKTNRPDVVFNLFEGVYGLSQSEALIPLALELMQVPYTGSGPYTLQTCLNKPKTKRKLIEAELPTPDFQVFKPKEAIQSHLKFPLFVKPEHEDASIGISHQSLVNNQGDLSRQVRYIWEKFRQGALVEPYIEGREFNVAIIDELEGNSYSPKVLPISEIDFSGMPARGPKIVTYDGKWEEQSPDYIGTVPICPAELSEAKQQELITLAKQVYQLFGCRGYARVDFRQNTQGEFYVIDVNPNPDLSRDAGLANAAKAVGLSYEMLLDKIIRLGLSKKQGN
jgi:D-alanine-D-alanine ligase